MEVRVNGHNFENSPLNDHPCHVWFKLAYWFQRRKFLSIFPIGSYVKTMSTDGGHLGWRSGSLDITLKVDHELGGNKCFISHFLLSGETFWLCHRILIEK
jgi:hypothetical protein